MESPSGSRCRVPVLNEGLTLLYEPADGKAVVNIIFVHGLGGHPKKSWTYEKRRARSGTSQQKSKSRLPKVGGTSRPKLQPDEEGDFEVDNDVYWPLDLLPKECPTARIWTWGYDSIVSHFFSDAANQSTILDHARDLLYAIDRKLDIADGHKIIFVAHSLGGIIVKEVLRRSERDDDTKLRNILTATYAIAFLGTPHRGSDSAAWANNFRRIAGAVGFDTNNTIINDLQLNSRVLQLSREEFLTQWRSHGFEVRTFREGKGMTAINVFNEKVVSDLSASFDDTRERSQVINKNHMEMCKFSSTDDPGYVNVGGELTSLVRDVEKQLREQELRLAGEVTMKKPLTADEENCLRSLSFPQIDGRYHDIKEPIGNTCDWIFDRAEFKEWLSCSQGLLWLKGHAGSAKSTLMKHAVRRFEEHAGISEGTSNALMARHFFNARGVELEKSFLGLMRSLLWQILSKARPLLERFIPAFHRKKSTHRPGWEWHAEELREFMLSTLASQLPPMYLYIDALDECEESERQDVVAFTEALMDRARSSDIPLRVIFSSRHFPDIDIEACQEIHPEEHNRTDISIYVKRRLSRLPDSKEALTLGEEVVRKAQGIFLWVVLVTDILLAKKNEPVQIMRDKLQQIPDGLIRLYDTILKGLSQEDRENMLLIIQWVLFAEMPLMPEDLLTAMAFDDENKYPSVKAWRESGMFIEDQSQIEGLIRARSRGMVEVKWNHFPNSSEWFSETEEPLETGKQTGTVQFIHESARAFFLHDNEDTLAILAPALREKFVGSSHDRLARSCLNFLGIEELRLWYEQAKPTVEALMQKHDKTDGVEKFNARNRYFRALRRLNITELPFQSYASEHVLVHAQHAELNKIEPTHFVNLFDNHHGNVFKSWTLVHDRWKPRSSGRDLLQGPRPALLYAFSSYNLPSCVKYLLQSGVDPNHDCGSDRRFPLILAAEDGFLEVVRLLLDHKAEIEARGVDESTALHVASGMGQVEIVRLLLERGADIEARDDSGRTPLYLAFQNNFSWRNIDGDETIRLLLMHEANVETKDESQNTLLHAAAQRSNEAIVQLLLNRGLAVDAQNEEHETALHVAVSWGNEAVAQLLLGNKADAKVRNKGGETALHVAAGLGNEAVTQVLLAQKPNIDVPNDEGRTALQFAVVYGHEAVIRLLLAHGANIETRDYRGRTALHFAAACGREAGIRLLLATGANVEVQTHKGRTALHMAATRGHKARMLLLLAHGASIETVDHEGRTALQITAACGHEAVIGLLLAHNANIETMDHEGRTALHLAAAEGHEAVIRLLLTHRANIETMDHKGRTALQWAMKGRRNCAHDKWSDGGETLQEFDEVIQLLETRADELKIPVSSLLHSLDSDNPDVSSDRDDRDDSDYSDESLDYIPYTISPEALSDHHIQSW